MKGREKRVLDFVLTSSMEMEPFSDRRSEEATGELEANGLLARSGIVLVAMLSATGRQLWRVRGRKSKEV